jgi:hypothetical protein
MRSIARWALAFLPCSFASSPAFAEPPAATPDASVTVPAPRSAEGPPAAAELAEERAFEAEARRYQRLAAFTERLVREREQHEFEVAAERHRRLADLTRRLAEKAEREVESAFEADVALFLRKLELTRELAARHAAAPGALPERSFVPEPVPSW